MLLSLAAAATVAEGPAGTSISYSTCAPTLNPVFQRCPGENQGGARCEWGEGGQACYNTA